MRYKKWFANRSQLTDILKSTALAQEFADASKEFDVADEIRLLQDIWEHEYDGSWVYTAAQEERKRVVKKRRLEVYQS
jgi:hypothetical protein